MPDRTPTRREKIVGIAGAAIGLVILGVTSWGTHRWIGFLAGLVIMAALVALAAVNHWRRKNAKGS